MYYIYMCVLFNLQYVYIYVHIHMYTNNHNYIYMVPSQNCVWNVPRCSGRMERRGFVTGLVPDLWNVMKYRLYIKRNIYMYAVYLYIIYISRICTLKLLTLAAAHFHFSSARHPCCTPVQRRFALHG